MTGASAIVTAVKRISPDTRVLMLGGHVAALPERTLLEESCDYVTSDEGLYGVSDLLTALREHESPDLKRVRGLGLPRGIGGSRRMRRRRWSRTSSTRCPVSPGICCRCRGTARTTGTVSAAIDREPYAAIYTTLGCPYHCSFCCIQAPFKSGEKALGLRQNVNSYRFWSPVTASSNRSICSSIDTACATSSSPTRCSCCIRAT